MKQLTSTILLFLICHLSLQIHGKSGDINQEGYQNYMEMYNLKEDFFRQWTQETENGTISLNLTKSKDDIETNDVYGTVLIESKLPFEANMDLRLSLEFGRRDHFSQLRRRRYTLFGDPDDGNFTIFTIATEKGTKENLTDYRWWTSVPQNNKTFRYDFFEYPGSFYQDQSSNLTNRIYMDNNTARFSFKTTMEQNEHQQFIMSWGLFPSKYNYTNEYVYAAHLDKNNSNGTWMPLIEEFNIGYVHPPFFSKFEIQLNDFLLWNLYWWGHFTFGTIPLVAPIVNIMFFPIQRLLFTLKTIWYFWYIILMDSNDPNIKDYTFGNWFYYLVFSGFLQDLIWPTLWVWSIIPIFNWLNFWWIQLYFWIIAYPTVEQPEPESE